MWAFFWLEVFILFAELRQVNGTALLQKISELLFKPKKVSYILALEDTLSNFLKKMNTRMVLWDINSYNFLPQKQFLVFFAKTVSTRNLNSQSIQSRMCSIQVKKKTMDRLTLCRPSWMAVYSLSTTCFPNMLTEPKEEPNELPRSQSCILKDKSVGLQEDLQCAQNLHRYRDV